MSWLAWPVSFWRISSGTSALAIAELKLCRSEWNDSRETFRPSFPSFLRATPSSMPARSISLLNAMLAAFQHHEEGNYISAIPLFLIQSDGIGTEIFGNSPVSRKSNRSLDKWLSQRIRGKGLRYMEGFCVLSTRRCRSPPTPMSSECSGIPSTGTRFFMAATLRTQLNAAHSKPSPGFSMWQASPF
jgi:hypothetical protein